MRVIATYITRRHTFRVLSQHPGDELINSCAGTTANKRCLAYPPWCGPRGRRFHVQLRVERRVVQGNNNVMRRERKVQTAALSDHREERKEQRGGERAEMESRGTPA